MTQQTADEIRSNGRHRSPWGRSKRILPIRWGRIAVAVAALAVLVVSLVLIRGRGSGETPPLTSDPAGAPTVVLAPTQGNQPPVPTRSPTAAASAPGSAAASAGALVPTAPAGSLEAPAPRAGSTTHPGGAAPPAAPGDSQPTGPVIGLSRTDVAFGDVESTIRLDLLGVGTEPARVRVGSTPAWVRVVPDRDVVDPGGEVPLVVTLDRAAAPPGPIDLAVPVTAVDGSGGGDLRITATVSGAPELRGVAASPRSLVPGGCVTDQDASQAVVTATVIDPTGVFGVEVEVRTPDGQVRTTPLRLNEAVDDRSIWSGLIGPAPAAGTLHYTAIATDLDGRRSEVEGSLDVRACPAG